MDAARQALRFSIPGSVLVLLSFGLVIASLALQNVAPSSILNPINENVAALVGVLAVIPIGFLTYQAYYLGVRPIVWTSRLPRLRARPRIDRGAGILSAFSAAEQAQIRQLYKLIEFGGKDDPRRECGKPSNAREAEELAERERLILDSEIKGTITVSRQDRLEHSKGLKKIVLSQAGFDGDPETRIPTWKKGTPKPCHDRRSTQTSCSIAAPGWSPSPAAPLPT